MLQMALQLTTGLFLLLKSHSTMCFTIRRFVLSQKFAGKFGKFTTMISFEVWVLFFLFFMSLSYSEMNRVIKIDLC